MIATTPQKLTAAETSRGVALERLIRVVQALQRERYGLLLDDLVAEVSEYMGRPWCHRTIRRDIQILTYVGLAEIIDCRCCWIGTGGFFEQPATAISLAADRAIHQQQAHWFQADPETR
ncbi:hypothetical protein ETAA8_06500 [Anatilimnocola aggregata]|uniref:Uncharacterized protein n=1 Tax=Anatilimnocola aggregata TaxID=2528021 RepID=A0A517Y5U4_9BACT|nr:hypothetical protein [Anatilimnocola aggregata]QDU25580.1 hypothetical protein ETAA8_06500 [Anatilimnocola aggregata]